MITTTTQPTEGQILTVNGEAFVIEGVSIEPNYRAISPDFGGLPQKIRLRLHTGEWRWLTLCGEPGSGEYTYMLVGSNVLNETGSIQ